jgi:4-hydroxymandelate oxidase
VFIATPPAPTVAASTARRELALVRAARDTFPGPAGFLADPDNRARTAGYLADLAAAYGEKAERFEEAAASGQSYGDMAAALITSVVPADEPVDLLILAYSVHDLWPSRQTAAYLSGVTPGAPMAFAVCDQGSAAGFTGLRIARGYAASAGVRRALLIVVEQAALPYDCPVPLPLRHQAVAMLYAADDQSGVRLTGLRQHADVRPGDVAGRAASDLAELARGRDTTLVLSDALAAAWPAPQAENVRVVAPGQPATGIWSELVDEVEGDDRRDLLVAADYDPDLRYLCLTGFATT